MNWKLVVQLSMFGLAMGVATVFVIPSKVEPFCWLPIFVITAYAIAKATSRPFVHGVMVGIANSVWITAAHVILYDPYIARHAEEASMMAGSPIPPRIAMLIIGPVIGVVSGLVIGLFAWIAAKMVRPITTQPA
jgi:hypothetical protein